MVEVAKTTKTAVYDADSIVFLDQMIHVQKRVSFYLGSNPLDTAMREIVDNSVDEVRAGFGTKVVLSLRSDGSVQVDDDGRGVPAGINTRSGKSGIIMALGTIGSGGKFGSDNYDATASMGLNGIGAAATCATSKRFDVTVYQGGEIHTLSFKNGKPGFFAKDADPESEFTSSEKVNTVKDGRSSAEKKARPTGTTIRYWSNVSFFPPTDELHVDELVNLLRFTSFLVPSLVAVVNDLRDPENPVVHTFDYEGGVTEMLDVIAKGGKLHDTLSLSIVGSLTETVQVVQPDGSVKPELVERKIPIDVALRWGTGYDADGYSFVNTIHTPLGGTHVRGFERALAKALGDKIASTRGLVRAKDESPVIDDMLEGLTYVLSISQPEPSFIGQDKQRLGGNEVGRVVQNAVTEELARWLEQRKNLDAVRIIMQKVVSASQNRQAARAQKEVSRRKTSLQGASMPAKLVDCSESNALHTELHIVEGDSALGSMRQARDSRYQALIPIRGKIINAHKAALKDVLANAEVSDIVQVLGSGMGKSFELENLRYGRIIITADADADGAHIRTLLISLFWNLMRPLIEDGRLYSSVSPLFSIKTLGKDAETIYLLDEDALATKVAELDKKGIKHGPAGRFKGLGEMDFNELWDTTIDPARRTLRQITIDDAKEAERMMDLAMGDVVSDRRDWIMSSRALLSEGDLDV